MWRLKELDSRPYVEKKDYALCLPFRPFTQTREAYKLFKPPPSFLFQHGILTCCKGVVGVQVSFQVRRKRPALEQENR